MILLINQGLRERNEQIDGYKKNEAYCNVCGIKTMQ